MATSISLEDAGYHVTVAYDGQQGLELAIENCPDLIITDFMMPRMTGPEMVGILQNRGIAVPVVFTTSVPLLQLPKSIKYAAYLPKPYSDVQLLAVLKQFVS